MLGRKSRLWSAACCVPATFKEQSKRFATACCDDKSDFSLQSYKNIQRYVNLVKKRRVGNNYDSHPFPLEVESKESELYQALTQVWYTACLTGKLTNRDSHRTDAMPIIKDITLANMCGVKLMEAAMHLDRESIFKNNVVVRNCKSVEIDISWLNPEILEVVGSSCSWRKLDKYTSLTIEPVKCVLHTAASQGTHVGILSDHAKREGFVGSMVVFLGSEFTGGQLEIVHDEQVCVLTEQNSWIAMRKGCAYTSHPVTSGTRVSLIYDIYGNPNTRSTTSLTLEPGDINCSVKDGEKAQKNDSDGDSGDKYYDEAFRNHYSDDEYVDTVEPSYLYHTYQRTYKPTSLNAVDTPPPVLQKNPVPVETQNRIHAALNVELKRHRSILIALQNVYKEGQSTHDLSGEDIVLCSLFSEQYNVELVQATVCTREHLPTGALYSADIVRDVLSLSDQPSKRHFIQCKAKIVLPNQLKQHQVLAMGDDSYGACTVYLVSALRVTRNL